MSDVGRIPCPECGAPCLTQEVSCWQCGAPLRSAPRPTEVAAAGTPSPPPLIWFGDESDSPPEPAVTPAPRPAAASAVPTAVAGAPAVPVMRLTFCKGCGFQNEEDAHECARCHRALEIVEAGSIGEIAQLPRAWGFDVLGAAWLLLGFAAVYCGQFLVKADPKHPGVTWADYFWTGIVVCAPGVLVMVRHYFCRLLFWAMTLGSLLVWAVIGFIWLFVGLQTTPNGAVGLAWLGLLSALSAVSYGTVRANDAFDYGV